MSKIILYPTETLYALGVNALDEDANQELENLKGRGSNKYSSWLVRSVEDMEKYAVVTREAMEIVDRFLPGSLTLILDAKDTVPEFRRGEHNEVSFRVSPDPVAQKLIAEYMQERDVPLTCTSANVSGSPTFSTVPEILQQFGAKANKITEVYDDGSRKGLASTVVKVSSTGEVKILREGDISEEEIFEVLK